MKVGTVSAELDANADRWERETRRAASSLGKVKHSAQETSRAVERLERETAQASRGLGRLSSTAQQAGSMAASLRGGVLAASAGLAVLGSGIAKVVQAANVQIAAETKLASAIRATSHAIDGGRLRQLATDLQGVTTFGDEATIEMMAMMVAMGANERAITTLSPLVLDLATAFGKSLPEASKAVGKSLATGEFALAEYGIALADADRKAFKAASTQERLAILTDKLTGAVGGAAVDVAAATGGLQQFENALGDTFEVLGSLIQQDATSFFAEMAQHISSMNEELGGTVGDLLEVRKAIGSLGEVIEETFSAELRTATSQFFGDFIDNVAASASPVMALANALDFARRSWNNFLDGVGHSESFLKIGTLNPLEGVANWQRDREAARPAFAYEGEEGMSVPDFGSGMSTDDGMSIDHSLGMAADATKNETRATKDVTAAILDVVPAAKDLGGALSQVTIGAESASSMLDGLQADRALRAPEVVAISESEWRNGGASPLAPDAAPTALLSAEHIAAEHERARARDQEAAQALAGGIASGVANADWAGVGTLLGTAAGIPMAGLIMGVFEKGAEMWSNLLSAVLDNTVGVLTPQGNFSGALAGAGAIGSAAMPLAGAYGAMGLGVAGSVALSTGPVGLAAAAPVAAGGAALGAGIGVAGGVAAFGAVLAHATSQTKSFGRFTSVLEHAFGQLVNAMEPVFNQLMPLAGLLHKGVSLFAQAFGGLVDIEIFVEPVFNALHGLGRLVLSTNVVIAELALAFGRTYNSVATMHNAFHDGAEGVLLAAADFMEGFGLSGDALRDSAADIADLSKMSKLNTSDLEARRDNAKEALDEYSAMDSGDLGEYANGIADLADATADNTDQLREFNRSMSNVPAHYRVALAEYNSETPVSAPGAQAGQAYGDRITLNGPAYFDSNSPIGAQARKEARRQRGSLNRGGSRNGPGKHN